jgi:cbb3-type cytochrome oxidase subunit 3
LSTFLLCLFLLLTIASLDPDNPLIQVLDRQEAAFPAKKTIAMFLISLALIISIFRLAKQNKINMDDYNFKDSSGLHENKNS